MARTRRAWRATAVAVGVAALVAGCACDVELGDLGDPGKGTDSQHLDVGADPSTGLEDGTVVRVIGKGFGTAPAGTIVGVALCLQEADTEARGVDACDTVSGARFASSPDGALDATFAVPRVITVGGKAYDCAERPGRCLLVAADANDYDRSGGTPVSFREGLGPADLVIRTERPSTDRLGAFADPAGPYQAGTPVTVAAAGFQPGEPLVLARCTDQFALGASAADACEPLDSSAVLTAILRSLPEDAPKADEAGKAVVDLTVTAEVDPPFGDGAVDCATGTDRCALVVAAAADTKRSAVVPYTIVA